MSGRDADELGSAVAGAMREAARVAILPRYQALQANDVMEKSASDVVTVADRECEALLAEALARLAGGRVAMKAINHFGDEVMKVFGV